MKTRAFVLVLLLATAFVALAPSASAASRCDSLTSDDCAGLVCYRQTCVRDYPSELCQYMGPECILDGTWLCRHMDNCVILDE